MLVRLIAAALTDGPLGAPQTVSISNDTSTASNANTAGIILKSTGAYAKYISDTPIETGYWLAPQTNMGEYEAYATLLSGDTPATGTFGSWLPLSTTRTWSNACFIEDETQVSSVQIEIRWTGNNVVQDTATYTLTAAGPPTAP